MSRYHYYDDEDLQAVKRILDGGNLCSSGRPDCESEQFAREFAAEFGSPYGLAIVNAMAGLHVAVGASGAGAGTEVVCDPLCVFGALAAMYHNAVPIFADINLDTQTMDPAALEATISERTKAVIVTHWAGLMADMDPILDIAKRYGLFVIEDCSHAIYAQYKGRYAGTIGDVGVFSFQQSKQMALGDGGMTLMRDPAVRQFMFEMTTFGTCPSRLSWNYRMNEVVAAIGRVQLKRARSYVDICIANASLLNEAVRGFEAIIKPQRNPDANVYVHTYHLWSARFEGDHVGVDYKAFQEACAARGLPFSFGYIGAPAYKQPVIRDQIGYGNDCPRGCPLARRHPDYTQDLCPNVEYLMPRLILCGTGGERSYYEHIAEGLRAVLESFA